MIKLAKILYPTDFSDLSLVALKYAKSFAKQYGAQLHCISVVDEGYQYWLALGPEGVPMAIDIDQLIESHRKRMSEFVAEHLSDVDGLITKVITGKPFVEIVEYAKEQAIDMIVLATHGRSGLSHILLGSVAERVVRKAPCPVLTCRPGEHEFVNP